ncbi:MAG: NACHT domain-containing protein, partial [Leptolyngbyaceae cyanobacterium CAN_BIN12]|nr:NACHT domain-containing protein [Leptolyngbyaceae cyanobacterium CAN_BIN12]
MPSPEEINAIFDRSLAGQATEADIRALRLELQQGKYRIDAEQLNANEIHIGDRIYYGADAEAIKTVLRSVLDEQQKLLEQQRAKRPRIERDFLGMMKAEVADSLKQSLHHAVLMNLGKEEQPEQVERLWDAKIKVANHPNALLPSDTKIIEVFDREDIAGRLLILGNPGSGKTTTLLDLAKALLDRAEIEPDFPMPVLFNLSSWKDDNQPLHEWMVQELKLRVRSDITRKWLDKHKLLPMLDGLDEMKSDRQETCVEAINQQLLTGEKSLPHLVVCSRDEEYDNYETKLLLNGAVYIQELTIEKILSYLNSVNQTELCHALDRDSDLLALVRTPLFLSIAALAFQEFSYERWQTLTTTEARIEHLLDAYVQKMMERKLEPSTLKNLYGKRQPPSNRKTQTWLSMMALPMFARSQTEFLIEEIPWLLSRTFKFKLFILFTLLIIAFAFILYFSSPRAYENISVWAFPAICVFSWCIFQSLMVGNIELVESLEFSWKQAKENFIQSLIFWQPLAIFFGISFELWNQDPIFFYLIFFPFLSCKSHFKKRSGKIAIGLLSVVLIINIHNSLWQVFLNVLICELGVILGALTTGFLGGLKTTEIKVKRSPNQGIWKSAKNAVLAFLIAGLMSTLLDGVLGLIVTLVFTGRTHLIFNL